MSKFRDLLADLFKTDEQKLRERKRRLQHPHMIDAKRHWDWDTGYSDIEDEETNGQKNNTNTTPRRK
jgi:hypothetical protein